MIKQVSADSVMDETARDRELIGELRAAGPRPAPPPDGLERILDAARKSWEATVERRRRERIRGGLVAAAGLACLVLAGWWWRSERLPIETAARPALAGWVERWAGDARVGRRPAERRVLRLGTLLQTAPASGSPSFLSFRLSGGASIRLDADSVARLLATDMVALERGALYVTTPEGRHAALTVRTPLGEVRDVGTRFEVRLDGPPGLLVRVRDGQIVVRRGDAERRASAGQELAWSRQGEPVVERIQTFGETWSWVEAAAVAPEIEGRSLEEFLDWYARETGRRLEYADPDLATQVGSIHLHGSIEGLVPDQALAVVLEGSGLVERRQPGRVRIERARKPR